MKPRMGLTLVGTLLVGLVMLPCCSGSDTKGSSTQSDGSGSGRLDGLVFSSDHGSVTGDHGSATGDCTASGCPKDNVCCKSPLPCAGMCLADCRVSGTTCPQQASACDKTTGMCLPASGDGGPLPTGDGGPKPPLGDGGPKPPLGDGGEDCAKTGCPKDNVCCQLPLPCAGMCVADCRISGTTCPQQAPTCDQTTGACK
jgi:hypothetical protein